MGPQAPPVADGGGGVQAALRFLAAARRDPVLRERLTALEPEAGFAELLPIAQTAGFPLTAEDLHAAFVHDWCLRRALQPRA